MNSSSGERIDRFDGAVSAIERLCGKTVDVRVRGCTEDSIVVATLSGILTRGGVPHSEVSQIPLTDDTEATVFHVGEDPANHFLLWPDRFRWAVLDPSLGSVEIVTSEATLIVTRRRPWVD